MSLNAVGILNAVVSHAQALGRFERVNSHEPKNAPGSGLTCSVWLQSIGPAEGQSGLAATSVRLVFNVMIFSSLQQDPADAIDLDILDAVDDLFTAYSGDFDLGGLVREVDLLGISGAPLSAEAGYVQIGEQKYRVMTITLPLNLNDVWEQVA